jgi:hypothetical protein
VNDTFGTMSDAGYKVAASALAHQSMYFQQQAISVTSYFRMAILFCLIRMSSFLRYVVQTGLGRSGKF